MDLRRSARFVLKSLSSSCRASYEATGQYLSMMEMIGATMTPALAALARSAQALQPMFLVFHPGALSGRSTCTPGTRPCWAGPSGVFIVVGEVEGVDCQFREEVIGPDSCMWSAIRTANPIARRKRTAEVSASPFRGAEVEYRRALLDGGQRPAM